jgi:hypothetical protein
MFHKIKLVKTLVISYSDFNKMLQCNWQRLKLIFLKQKKCSISFAMSVQHSALHATNREHLNGL